jgi:hypothetical protein
MVSVFQRQISYSSLLVVASSSCGLIAVAKGQDIDIHFNHPHGSLKFGLASDWYLSPTKDELIKPPNPH